MLGRTHAIPGCAAPQVCEIRKPRAQTGESPSSLRSGDVSVARARGCWSTSARTPVIMRNHRGRTANERKRSYWPVPETLLGFTIDTRTFINIEESPTKTRTLLVR